MDGIGADVEMEDIVVEKIDGERLGNSRDALEDSFDVHVATAGEDEEELIVMPGSDFVGKADVDFDDLRDISECF